MDRTNRIASVYTIKQHINDLRNEPNTSNYCNICFRQGCKEHNLGTCNRKDALDSLTWWLEIAIQEADVLLLGENEDVIVPKFPKGRGKRIGKRKYDHVPALENLIFIYVDGEGNESCYNEKGDVIEPYPSNADISSPGIYWGYIYNNEFYLLTTFDNGEFYGSRQQLQPIKEIPLDAPISGFWHLPKGRISYKEFAEGLIKT